MKRTTLFCLALMMALPSWSQESVKDVQRSIKTVEQETAREKDLTAAESKRHAAFLETNRQKLSALAQQEASLKVQLDSMRAEANTLRAEAQKAAGGARYFEGRKNKYAQDLARLIDSIAPRLASDFPYKNEEAVLSVRDAASQLRKGVISPDEALGRVLELLLDRIRLGYTTESWSGYLAYQGRSIPGKFLRYGTVAALFVSQDGEEVFWLSRSGKEYAWRNAGDNLNLRASLKEAMKVAEGKTPPKLVTIPVATPKALKGEKP